MTKTRLYLVLEPQERRALGVLANREMREVREQARFMLRQELQNQGLLPDEPKQQPAPAGEGSSGRRQ